MIGNLVEWVRNAEYTPAGQTGAAYTLDPWYADLCV